MYIYYTYAMIFYTSRLCQNNYGYFILIILILCSTYLTDTSECGGRLNGFYCETLNAVKVHHNSSNKIYLFLVFCRKLAISKAWKNLFFNAKSLNNNNSSNEKKMGFVNNFSLHPNVPSTATRIQTHFL